MDAAPSPIVTLGITCFNAEASILRAIRAAAAQTWQNTEILIVDDCSTDNSVALINDAIKDLPNARLIQHEKNMGVAAARSTLLNNAHGAFLAFADDDDESLPERLTTQVTRILAYEAAYDTRMIACYASGHRLYPNGHRLEIKAIGTRGIIPQGPAMADRMLFFRTIDGWDYGGTPACALMARVSTMKEVGGFDPAFRRVEDIDWAIRFALRGGHFIGCPENLYRQYATDGSDKTAEKNLAAELQLVDKHRGYLEDVGYYTYARLWPRLRYAYFTKRYPLMLGVFALLLVRYPLPVLRHIIRTGPARLRRDANINRKAAA